jgi:hypothetical protein
MMLPRDRHPILLSLLALSLTLLTGCDNPVVDTPPPTLTIDDIADIAASTLGAESGGMMVHMPDLVTAAHGRAIVDRAGDKRPSPQTDRSVRRSDTTNHDGDGYGYDLDVLYSYKYSSTTFPQQDQFDPRLDFLILKGHISRGTFVTPTLAGTDSGNFSWLLRNLTLAEPTYMLDGGYLRHRRVTLLRKGLTLTLDVGISFVDLQVDPSTGTVRSSDRNFASIILTNLKWGNGEPIVGTADSTARSYSGTVHINDGGTAVLAITDENDNGHIYTIDTRIGRLK